MNRPETMKNDENQQGWTWQYQLPNPELGNEQLGCPCCGPSGKKGGSPAPLGLCPRCGHDAWSYYLNVERTHYGFCLDCGVHWEGGGNIFSRWKDERGLGPKASELLWRVNSAFLDMLEKVEGVQRPPESKVL